MIRVLLVDDHDLVRQGVRALIDQEATLEVVGEAGDGGVAIELAQKLRPDVVLLDISLGQGLGGLESAEAILRGRPETKIVMLTRHLDSEYVKRAVKIGTHGYLPKNCGAEQLREAIHVVHGGRRYLHPSISDELVELLSRGDSLEPDDYDRLSPREKQVFKLLAEGKTSREIGRQLQITTKTAMSHRANLMGKLNLHSRAELIRYAVRKKVIEI